MSFSTFIYMVLSWQHALVDAINPFLNIPWSLRWRLLCCHFLISITYPFKALPPFWKNAYSTIWIPTRSGKTLRALVFPPPLAATKPGLKPLHVNIHSGAFIGGIPEAHTDFNQLVTLRTGAVVVALSHRLAPRHPYPAAHDDIEDALSWLETHAASRLHVDFSTLTLSGFSAGGNLMYLAGARARAAVAFYAPVDLRLPPWEKPKPEKLRRLRDPMAWMLPLYDCYAGPRRAATVADVRLHPTLRRVADLPRHVMHVVAGMDVCVDEQVDFIERVDGEFEREGRGRRAEVVVYGDVVHGWVELPSSLGLGLGEKKEAFERAVEFIAAAQGEQER